MSTRDSHAGTHSKNGYRSALTEDDDEHHKRTDDSFTAV